MKKIQVKKDSIFLKILWLHTLNNYFNYRNQKKRSYYENHELCGFTIVKDLPCSEKYSTDKLEYEPFSENELEKYFNDQGDGLHLISGNKISTKVILDTANYLAKKKYKVNNFQTIATAFLPNDYFRRNAKEISFKDLGSRTTVCLSSALLGNESTEVYKLGQTIYSANVGKLSKFTNKGLQMDAVFERYDSSKFHVDIDFDFFRYKNKKLINKFSDVLVINIYHFDDKYKKLRKVAEFLIRPKDLEDYYNNTLTNVEFFKNEGVILPKADSPFQRTLNAFIKKSSVASFFLL